MIHIRGVIWPTASKTYTIGPKRSACVASNARSAQFHAVKGNSSGHVQR